MSWQVDIQSSLHKQEFIMYNICICGGTCSERRGDWMFYWNANTSSLRKTVTQNEREFTHSGEMLTVWIGVWTHCFHHDSCSLLCVLFWKSHLFHNENSLVLLNQCLVDQLQVTLSTVSSRKVLTAPHTHLINSYFPNHSKSQ